MHRTHTFEFCPILIGGRKKYIINLPLDAEPITFKTMTSDMKSWHGQIKEKHNGTAIAMIRDNGQLIEVQGDVVGAVAKNGPCVVMEHLTIYGRMSYMIGDQEILQGNQNFVNFGLPGRKYIRIDIYTGDSIVVDEYGND